MTSASFDWSISGGLRSSRLYGCDELQLGVVFHRHSHAPFAVEEDEGAVFRIRGFRIRGSLTPYPST